MAVATAINADPSGDMFGHLVEQRQKAARKATRRS
jgi:hypothetical protein